MNKPQLLNSLKEKGFSDKIIKAFDKVKREDFIDDNLKQHAYLDEPLPIGQGQTISQPYTIAFMLKLLELKDNQKILEIGSGSGYVLALINEISKKSKIYGIERIEALVEKSSDVLKSKRKIKIIYGDGSKILEKHAPYDRILISASTNKIPTHFYTQLKDNGIMVCPVQNSIYQIKKRDNKITKKEFYGFIFVPLVED